MQSLISTKTQSWLVWFLRGLLIVGFLLLLTRLVELQIIRGAYFKELAEGNRIRRVPITAARGEIHARGGEILATNKEVRRKVVFYDGGYKKVEREQKEGSDLITEWIREYPEGSKLAHITGYIGEVNEEELGKIMAECPDKGPRKLQELVGRAGLENQYDCVLTGYDGEELVEVDAENNKVRTLGRKMPVQGDNIVTTIDFGLQKKIVEVFAGKKGAVIVTDAKGQVLGLYSSVSYDPNIFVKDGNEKNIQSVLSDKNLPLFNRVIAGEFHPGSVFKPVVATAALEEGVIDEDYIYEDTGQITISNIYGSFSYKNWYFTQYGGVEGKIGLERAIARSTDTFFYKIGELTGVDNLVNWAGKFGLDNLTGIDIPGEVSGLIPSPEWKMRVKGERWFLGNTYHMSIGQGDIALTPMGINQAISAIANGGKLCQPHIFSIEASGNFQPARPAGGFPISNFQCRDLGIKIENIALIKKGMVGVCSPGGTGYTFFDFEQKSGRSVACKTGTAETENGEPHAWFVAFAPADNPEIVATVLVENGGEGSKVAGPIAREIFNYWFKVPEATPSATLIPQPANE